ncbi:MAG: hypothetical protein QOH35_4810, partial [Acidobacteriaceae bacterium]|nr:hypothetical protein [Acidobacteriaceae bacterium]
MNLANVSKLDRKIRSTLLRTRGTRPISSTLLNR